MTVRDVRLYGDPVLKAQATEITVFDAGLEALAADMLETMEDSGGVGLAANQIGLTKRIFVYDCSHVNPGMRGVLINPVWDPVGEATQTGREGCLSIPGISLDTTRYQTVAVRGFDVAGRPVGMIVSGLMARCVQHETDHLDGLLFLERLTPELRKDAMATIRTSDWFNS